ncbi:MAG: ThiF family adenylyltransferase [Planctomycetaceae bacterium]|jgi:adenylyltransferase/sulfurtransferase|nr:ThiF family adenylyltransferase [Planctomycetaceae bacterium]
MSTFRIKPNRPDTEKLKVDDMNPFDRQERIGWWNQDKLREAKVLVIGAGAIGNETLKNLAMLGIGNILLCDMDTISVSNLSRTVLFRKADAGKKKAETAAQRVKEMCLEESSRVDFFDGDIVWELGTGVYRYFDIVLGCLDNIETRFAVNKNCQLVAKPFIDAGISELACSVSVFGINEGACYQCFADKEQMNSARKRYSCDNFKKRMFGERRMSTVQISSAIVSALQVQEAVKIITGKRAAISKKLFFQGTVNDFDIFDLQREEDCLAHASYDSIIETPLTNAVKLRRFLNFVSQEDKSGKGAALDLRGDRDFLRSIKCATCGKQTFFYKPVFRLFGDEVICSNCKKQDGERFVIGEYDYIPDFDMNCEDTLLDLTLEQLGIPKLHIVTVRDTAGGYKHYELSGDVKNVMPNISNQ